jgi:hypothetical protein
MNVVLWFNSLQKLCSIRNVLGISLPRARFDFDGTVIGKDFCKELKMKKLFVITVIMLWVSNSFAQLREAKGTISKSSLYGNVGMNGLAFSISYDYRFSRKSAGLGVHAGIGFVPTFFFGNILTLPVGATYLFGSGPHYIETGLGYTYCHFNSGEERKIFGRDISTVNFGFVIPSVGYRFQPPQGGFTWKILISPLIGSGYSFFWAGASVGFTFNRRP